MNDKDVEAKIDDLARMVAGGFTEVRSDVSELRRDMATKADLERLRGDLDIMLDKHIGFFRKDFDELAARVKRLEMAIFK